MPQVVAEAIVPVTPDVAFAVSQTHGAVRMLWDPFIRRQYFLDGADAPAKGVRTRTLSRLGPAMTSEYVSYRPPTSVGMTMTEGPWYFARFGGGWRFEPHPEGCRAVWKYTFTVRPGFLRFVADPLGRWLLGREIRRRIAAFADACGDDRVLSAVRT